MQVREDALCEIALGALLGGVSLGRAWVWGELVYVGCSEITAQSSQSGALTGSGCLLFPGVHSCLLTSCFHFLSFPLSVCFMILIVELRDLCFSNLPDFPWNSISMNSFLPERPRKDAQRGQNKSSQSLPF